MKNLLFRKYFDSVKRDYIGKIPPHLTVSNVDEFGTLISMYPPRFYPIEIVHDNIIDILGWKFEIEHCANESPVIVLTVDINFNEQGTIIITPLRYPFIATPSGKILKILGETNENF